MADSFFGFDTSLSNLNDDEGGGEPSEDEYDALNDETFGQDSEEFDWEVQHEHLALLDSSRRNNSGIDDAANEQLEASLSQLVLDETDAPQPRTLGSNVWRHDLSLPKPITPVQSLKNVCTVEELERQLRQPQQQPIGNQSYFQPRYQPVILQRPPGLQAPVPLPFAPQQQMGAMNQSLNKIIGQNQMNQMGQTNQLMQNHMGPNVNQLGPNVNQLGQNVNQMGQNVNQFMQSSNQMFQSTMGQGNLMNLSQNMQSMQVNQLMQNQMSQNQMVSNVQLGQMGPIGQPANQMGQNMQMNQGLSQLGQNMQMGQQSVNQPMVQNSQLGQNLNMNQLGQSMNPMGQNINQVGQNFNQMGPNINALGQQLNHNQIGQNVNPLGQSVNPMGQNMNQMGPNVNHMPPNVNNMGQNVNQLGPNVNNMGQNVNHIGPNVNQLGPNVNNMGQNVNHMGPNVNSMGPNIPNANQMGPNVNNMGPNVPNANQIGPNVNHMGPNLNQMAPNVNKMAPNVNNMGPNVNNMGPNVNNIGPNINQMAPNVNNMGQNVNQTGPNANQMIPNGHQFGGPGMNQFPHMNQSRMIAPPPGMNMPRQNFNSNMAPFNNFRAPSIQPKPAEQLNHPMNHQHLQPPTKNQTAQIPQKPLSNQPQIKPVKKVEQPKAQKSRVYNNSKTMPTQNLTSQNLVQLIQNTHPMLQLNSYHNASHHPMLNNRNLFSNNQLLNSHLFNQRQNGSFSNNRHSINGDDCSATSDDEYSGLMTQREKQWLINIQMLQLNTGTPYIHDFYYTVFLERQASKEKEGVKEAHKANQQNHPFYSGGNNSVKQESHPHGRERHNSNRHNSTSEDAPTPRTYVPTQFENSLGKLQCGSVTAPRKIIDVELVGTEPSRASSRAPSRASTTNPNEVPRELKRTKQILLDIEALYVVLLRLEELNDPLAISTALILKEREEKQKQLEAAQKELENEQEDESNLFLKNIESVQRRPKQDSPKSESIDKRQVVNLAVSQKPPVKNLLDEDKEELVGKMFAGLLHTDRLAQMLTVRKGRTLVCRFLARVPASHARLRGLWSRVLRALPSVARRADTMLAELVPHYRSYMLSTTGWGPVLEACALLAEALEPARTPYALTSSFTLSCICALLERASNLVNTPDATANERQWSKFLKTVARALKNTSLTVARPVQPLPEVKLMYHLKQIESRTTIEILQRGKSAEFVDVTKVDVHEQLVKHLC